MTLKQAFPEIATPVAPVVTPVKRIDYSKPIGMPTPGQYRRADILEAAADLVKQGWTKGTLERNGNYCLVGAVAHAGARLIDYDSYGYAAYVWYGKKDARRGTALAHWNDGLWTEGQYTVEQALRGRANLLRMGKET